VIVPRALEKFPEAHEVLFVDPRLAPVPEIGEIDIERGNFSLVHNDFMVGSGEMDIDGICNDGSREPVMRAGEWAFEV